MPATHRHQPQSCCACIPYEITAGYEKVYRAGLIQSNLNLSSNIYLSIYPNSTLLLLPIYIESNEQQLHAKMSDQNKKTYTQAAGEYYNQKYETWMPWIEDKYLSWFTKDNKASYATKRTFPSLTTYHFHSSLSFITPGAPEAQQSLTPCCRGAR
jgi:hypothetical protein